MLQKKNRKHKLENILINHLSLIEYFLIFYSFSLEKIEHFAVWLNMRKIRVTNKMNTMPTNLI